MFLLRIKLATTQAASEKQRIKTASTEENEVQQNKN